MIHDLTAGHFDAAGVVLKPIDLHIARRLLADLGSENADGVPTLDGSKVRFEDGCIVLPWKGGGTNRVAEEFARRLQRETGCLIADRGHHRIIAPETLVGLNGRGVHSAPAASRE
jgi:hypothetical protein